MASTVPAGILLTDLPDDLLYEISLISDVKAIYQLIFVSHRFRSIFQPAYYIEQLLGLGSIYRMHVDQIACLASNLVVLARSDSRLPQLVRNHVTYHGAIRLVERLLHADCCGVEPLTLTPLRDLIEICQLAIFLDIVPAICLHFYHFSKALRNFQRVFRIFGVTDSGDQIQVEVTDRIAAIINEFLLTSYNIQCGHRTVIRKLFSPLFSDTVLQLTIKSDRYDGGFPVFLLKNLPTSEIGVLRDPLNLLSLLRIGVRFPINEYLRHVPVTPSQFWDIAPFLYPSDAFYPSLPLLKTLIGDKRDDRAPVLMDSLKISKEWFQDWSGLFKCFHEAIIREDFQVFRCLERCFDLRACLRISPGRKQKLLQAATDAHAPDIIINNLRNCPDAYLKPDEIDERIPIQLYDGVIGEFLITNLPI